MADNELERGASFEFGSGEAANKSRSGAEGQASETRKRRESERGFAAMDPALQKEIARKGGAAVSKDREHMAEIGRKGGEAVSKDRDHMSEIGRKGGKAGGEQRPST
jgi:general stress protein YciG